MGKKLLHIISHTDLDGVVSAALAWHSSYGMSPMKISLAGYGIVDNLILEGIQNEQNILVLDLFCQKDRTVDQIDSWFSEDELPFVFDHHESNFARFAGRPWLVLDTNYCAAKVYYNWLKSNSSLVTKNNVTEKMKDIVEIANDRDLWINRFPESRLWQALVTLCGPWGVFTRLVADPSGKLTPDEYEVAVDFVHRQEQRFEKAFSEMASAKNGVAFTGEGILEFGDVSDFAGLVLDRNDDPPEILAVASRKITGEWAVSLRSRDGLSGKTVAILKDGKKVRGGGHENAAALYFPRNYSEERIRESIQTAVHTIKEKSRPTGATLGDVFRKAMENNDQSL